MVIGAVDFYMGQHGHFLEYVINRYIFKVPVSIENIFQSSGAVHAINTDSVYQEHKAFKRYHYTDYNWPYPPNTQWVVTVKHDNNLDIALLTNIFYRCHPGSIDTSEFSPEEIVKFQTEYLGLSDKTVQQKRKDWYDKLMSNWLESKIPYPTTDLPVFYFPYESFFELDKFLLSLRNLADFVSETFVYDSSLSLLWNQFIQKNQGYGLYQTVGQLFNSSVSNQSMTIPDDWKLQAFLNYKITQCFHVYEHDLLFGHDHYPKNTQEIYSIIQQHVEDFDRRF